MTRQWLTFCLAGAQATPKTLSVGATAAPCCNGSLALLTRAGVARSALHHALQALDQVFALVDQIVGPVKGVDLAAVVDDVLLVDGRLFHLKDGILDLGGDGHELLDVQFLHALLALGEGVLGFGGGEGLLVGHLLLLQHQLGGSEALVELLVLGGHLVVLLLQVGLGERREGIGVGVAGGSRLLLDDGPGRSLSDLLVGLAIAEGRHGGLSSIARQRASS